MISMCVCVCGLMQFSCYEKEPCKHFTNSFLFQGQYMITQIIIFFLLLHDPLYQHERSTCHINHSANVCICL